jgi:hypothetical protein
MEPLAALGGGMIGVSWILSQYLALHTTITGVTMRLFRKQSSYSNPMGFRAVVKDNGV